MKKNVILWSIAFVLAFSSCKKKNVEPTLPPETQTGAGTFGCKVNGKIWVPNGKPNIYASNLQVVYDETFENGNLGLIAYSGGNNEVVTISLSGLNNIGDYVINTIPTSISYINRTTVCAYYTQGNKDASGLLKITKLDKLNNIISGTFEFTIPSENLGCGIVNITDGRFDLKY